MSTAPSETGCFDSFAANLHDETEPVTSTQLSSGAKTALAVPSTYKAQAAGSRALTDATKLPLGVCDLTLRLKDYARTPIRWNTLPTYEELPILLTVSFTNRPEGVNQMDVNVIISELSKNSKMKGRVGSFSKYVRSTTYKDTVPIVTDEKGHSITIEIDHANAHSGEFHGGDGPYDVYMSFAPVGTGNAMSKSLVAKHNHADEDAASQIEETLKCTLYTPRTNLLARLFYAVRSFWAGF